MIKDEEFLKGTINTATTLHTLVHNKKNEIQLLKDERDLILRSVEQVKFELYIYLYSFCFHLEVHFIISQLI